MAAQQWALDQEQRQETIRRTAENIFALAYSQQKAVTDREAAEAAKNVEEKAYTVARIESQTTTGQRPADESLKAYTRKLAALVIEWVASVGKENGHAATAAVPSEEMDLTGDREFMTRESAGKALAPLLKEGSAIKRIKLSTKSFGGSDGSADVVADAFLAQTASLSDVDISDVIAGRPEVEALAALRILSSALGKLDLKRLNLSDNALGEKGLRACKDAFQNQAGLQFLALQNVGCSINACSALRELLTNSSHLTGLHFFNNMSDNAGATFIAEILGRAPQMMDFKMGSSRVGAQGGIALAEGLRAGAQLRKLDLSDNPMTAEVASALAHTIAGQPQLRALILNDISLMDEGIGPILEALVEGAPDLEELELALNEITQEGAKGLVAVLPKKKGLTLLNLRENELEDLGALFLAKAISSLQGLRKLDLTQNQIKRAGAVAVCKALQGSKGSLQHLELDENEISENGIDQMKGILEEAGILSALGSLEDNDADAEDEEEEGEEEGGDDDLSAAFARTGIN